VVAAAARTRIPVDDDDADADTVPPSSRSRNTGGSKNAAVDRSIAIRVREEDDEPYRIVSVQPGETILAALERSGRKGFSLSAPSDCRRGNCLTCAAKIVEGGGGILQNMASGGGRLDASASGLSPAAAQYLADRSLILTCSTRVVVPKDDDGSTTTLALQLGQCHDAWQGVYVDRLYEDEPAFEHAVRARGLRIAAERNVPAWIDETTRALRRQPLPRLENDKEDVEIEINEDDDDDAEDAS
jgi:ferredoxin